MKYTLMITIILTYKAVTFLTIKIITISSRLALTFALLLRTEFLQTFFMFTICILRTIN